MAPTLILSVEPQGGGSRFTRRVEMGASRDDAVDGPFHGGNVLQAERGLRREPKTCP